MAQKMSLLFLFSLERNVYNELVRLFLFHFFYETHYPWFYPR